MIPVMRTLSQRKLKAVARLLLAQRIENPSGWWWINGGGRPSKKDANKYLMACLLDYAQPFEVSWEKAKRLAEVQLGDPEDLWDSIAQYTLPEWMETWREWKSHRFPKAHERIWTFGQHVLKNYEGDARRIWEGCPARDVVARLESMRMGPQLSRNAVGGLHDCRLVSGGSDVKADLHVKRVVGRVFFGGPINEETVHEVCRLMHPENPWLLDQGLFWTGSDHCRPTNPDCENCLLSGECAWFSRQ
jgi:hypothetical protein